MRIITGSARGRKLKEPIGQNIRPTTDVVKESVFNIIQFDIEGRSVLDLFAGTGQLGIETLSRGAAQATFVDSSREAIALIKDNLKTTGFEAKVVQSEAIEFLSRKEKYDLIFLDPPYETTLLEKSLESIARFDKLNEGGIIICESRVNKELPELPAPYLLKKVYRYGKIKISLYGKAERQG